MCASSSFCNSITFYLRYKLHLMKRNLATTAISSCCQLFILIKIGFFPLQPFHFIKLTSSYLTLFSDFSGKFNESLMNVFIVFAAAFKERDIKSFCHLLSSLEIYYSHMGSITLVTYQYFNYILRSILKIR
ncbi:hypothetical protein X975_06091, partial [Stegodyphus mimosarum]